MTDVFELLVDDRGPANGRQAVRTASSVSVKALALACCFLACTLPASTLLGQATPFPRRTDQRLYVSGVANKYQLVERTIRELENDSSQIYYVVVVRSSGSGATATENYTRRLADQWKRAARSTSPPLDTRRSVLVVLAEQNRQLSVQPGSELESKYGLQSRVISQRLVQPHFIPHAKSGNYAEGLRILLRKLEAWVDDKDEDERRRVEAQKAREKRRQDELKQQTSAALKRARDALEQLRQDVSDRKPEDLPAPLPNADTFQKKLDAIAGRLARATAADRLEVNRLQQQLNAEQHRVRQFAPLRNVATVRMGEVDDAHATVRGLLEAQEKLGYRVNSVRGQLAELKPRIEAQRPLVATSPATASEALVKLRMELDDLKNRTVLLEELDKKYQTRRKQVESLQSQMRESWSEVRQTLVNVSGIGNELAEANNRIRQAENDQLTYENSLAILQEVSRSIESALREVDTRTQQHQRLERDRDAALDRLARFAGAVDETADAGVVVSDWQQDAKNWKSELENVGSGDAARYATWLATVRNIDNSIQAAQVAIGKRRAQHLQIQRQRESLDTSLREFATELEQASSSGVGVSDLSARATRLDYALRSLGRGARPEYAVWLRTLGQLSNELKELNGLLAKRREEHEALQKQLAKLDEDVKTTEEAVQLAAASGASVADLERDVRQVESRRQQLLSDAVASGSGYQQALAAASGWERKTGEWTIEANRRLAERRFFTRTIPAIVILSVLALLLLAALVTCVRYQLRLRRVRESAKRWRSRLDELYEQIDQLQRRHADLPSTDTDFTGPMSGETRRVYDSFDKLADQSRTAWLEQSEQLHDILRRVKSSRALDFRALAEADANLQLIDDRRFLELKQESADRIDQVEQAHEMATELLTATTEQLAAVDQHVEVLRAAFLPITPYASLLDECRGCRDSAANELASDPIGSAELLRSCDPQIRSLHEWTRAASALATRLKDLTDHLEKLNGAAAEQRARGIKLREENGDPDPHSAKAHKLRASAEASLRRGDVEEADEALTAAEREVQRGSDAIDRQLEAREYCQARLAAIADTVNQLGDKLDEAKRQLSQLHEQFSAESWQVVSQHVAQASEFLGQVEPIRAEAETLASDETQQYFAARSQLKHAERLLRQGEELVEQFGNYWRRLIDVRDQCQSRMAELATRREEIAALVRRHARIVGSQATQLQETARQQHEWLAAAVAAAQVHWQHVSQCQDQAFQTLDSAFEWAQSDVKWHEHFQAQLDAKTRQANDVGRILGASRDDRAAANRQFADAHQRLQELTTTGAADNADWKSLCRQLEGVAAKLQKAKRTAETDIRLAQQVRSELDDAERALRRAENFYSYGVSADTSRARRELSEARQLFSRHEYERALSEAQSAERAARDAEDDAERQATSRRWEKERRDRMMASSGGIGASHSLFNNNNSSLGISSSFGSSSFGSSSFGSSSSSSSSTSSSSSGWSGSTSQDSW